MAFELEQHENLRDGVRRIAHAELGAAIGELRASGAGEERRVHSIRKRTKKLRALLCLVRASIGEESYRLERAAIRSAAAALADARRGAVMLHAFDALVEHHADQIAPSAFAGLRSTLAHELVPISGRGATPEARRMALDLLENVDARVDAWRLEPAGFELVLPGLAGSVRRARKELARAFSSPTDEAMHELRKRAKEHWYHLRLLRPCWPELMDVTVGALHRLTELLGDDHDLADLQTLLVAHSERLRGEPLGALLALLDRRQRELRQTARPLAVRLFAERPRALGRRLRRYHEIWQAERPSGGARVRHELDRGADDGGVAQDANVPEPRRLD